MGTAATGSAGHRFAWIALLRIVAILVLALVVLLASLAGIGRWECAIPAIIAWIFSLIGALGGYLLGIYPRGDAFIMARLMLASLVRAGIPLAVLVVCKVEAPEFLNRGMVYFVILFYLVGLVADVVIHGAENRRNSAISPAEKNKSKSASRSPEVLR